MEEVTYTFISDKIPITVRVFDDPTGFVPVYDISVKVISSTTDIVLEKIREEKQEPMKGNASAVQPPPPAKTPPAQAPVAAEKKVKG